MIDWMTKMNNLILNLDKFHTTELGVTQIKKNLKLETDDVMNWCRQSKTQSILSKRVRIGMCIPIMPL